MIDNENPEWTAADVASISPTTRATNAYWFAPVETSRSAIAEADQIVQSRSARFASADALLNGFDEASRK